MAHQTQRKICLVKKCFQLPVKMRAYHSTVVQVISLSLSFSLIIRLFEFIVALAPFSKLYDGVGDVASEVIGSYLLLSVVVVDTVWSLYTFMSMFSLAHNFSCSLLIKMCGSPLLFPFDRWDLSFCHTLSSTPP